MAEIKIEKKKGIPVWAMLLGLILLALIIWAVVEMGDDFNVVDVGGRSTRAIARELAGWGDMIEVAEPPAVREELVRLGEALMRANLAK